MKSLMAKESPDKSILSISLLLLIIDFNYHFKYSAVLVIFLLGLGIFGGRGEACIAYVWNQAIKIVGIVNNVVVLTVIYLLILTPLGLIQRQYSENNNFRVKKGCGSYWVNVNNIQQVKDFNKPW